MKPIRTFVGLSAASLVALSGCAGLAAQYPALEGVLGVRPTATPFVLSRGHLRGTVFGASGKGQAIGLAFITTGGVSTFSANPSEEAAVDEDASLKDKDNLIVMHDFSADEDGSDVQPATRIIRKSKDAADPYVYLKLGEFFLEGVPEGNASLTASYGNVISPPNPITVYKNTIVEDVSLNLFIPVPLVQGPDGTIPHIVEWARLDPANGVSVSVLQKRTTDQTGSSFVDTTITYKPDPPDVAVTLKAPPGSPGTIITGYEVQYEYTTPNQIKQSQPPIIVGPILVPTPPLIVPPAQEIAFGPPIVIQIPIGSRTLNEIFSGEKDDQPGLVIATIEFKDESGAPVPNKELSALKVSVPLRAL